MKKSKLREDLGGVLMLLLLVLAIFELACDDTRPLIAGLYFGFAFLILFVETDGIRVVFMDDTTGPSK